MESCPAVVRSCMRKEAPPTTQSASQPAISILHVLTPMPAHVLFAGIIFASKMITYLHVHYMVRSLYVNHLRIHSLHERQISSDERRIIFG
jgi:hypothetical protein